MAYYPNAVYSVFSFLGFVVVIIPLRWHLEGTLNCYAAILFHVMLLVLAWNVGTCLYILWTALGCISGFVNSIIYKNTAQNIAPIWCYISKPCF
jgi:pheromone a factor receptor